MSGLNKKEEQFRSILQESAAEVNTSEIWDNISDRLPVRKDRKPILWFIMGLGFGLGIFSAILLRSDSHEARSADATSTAIEAPVKQETMDSRLALQKEKHNDLEQAASHESLIGHLDDSKSLIPNNNPFAVKADQKPADNGHFTRANRRAEITPANPNNTTALSTPPIVQIYDPPQGIQSIESLSQEAGGSSEDEHVAGTALAVRSTERHLNEIETSIGIVESEGRIEAQSQMLGIVRPSNDRVELKAIPGAMTGAVVYDNTVQEMHLPFAEATIRPLKRQVWASGLMLASGVNYGSSRYNVTGGDIPGFQSAVSREATVYAYGGELNWIQSHATGWSFMAGLAYNNVARVFRDQSVSRVVEEIEQPTTGIDAQGLEYTENVLLERTTLISHDRQWHRVHSYWDIQLGVGRELIGIGRMAVRLSGVVRYNVKTDNRGYYFDANTAGLIKFADANDAPYQSSTGVSTQLALNLEYRTNNYNLGIRPIWAYRPGSLTDSTAGYSLRQDSYGLQFYLTIKSF